MLISLLAPALAKDAKPVERPANRAKDASVDAAIALLVCQSETLADSQADWAVDIRQQIPNR